MDADLAYWWVIIAYRFTLEENEAIKGTPLTESQLKTMERAKEEKSVLGEIETEHVGYLDAPGTFYFEPWRV